ncbi:MAG: histidine kinase [Vicingaceae bacterium]
MKAGITSYLIKAKKYVDNVIILSNRRTIANLRVCVILLSTLALTLCIHNPVHSQDLFLTNYTVEDGLPSNECYDIIQDKEGFVWIGSSRGLARFNGGNFKVYSTKNGLPSNLNTRLYLGYDSTLWSYSHMQDFSAYQPLVDSFAPLNWEHTKGWLPNFKGFAHLGENEIIMGQSSCTESSILHLLNDSVIEEVGDSSAINIKNHESYTVIGLSPSNCSKAVLTDFSAGIRLSTPKEIIDINDVIKVADKNYFILSKNEVIHHITKDTVKRIRLEKGAADLLFIDSDKNLWVTCLNKNGAFRFKNADLGQTPQHYLKGYSISSFYEDQTHGLWFSSLESGIFHAVNKNHFIYTTNNGLPEKKITKSELINDQLWLAFRNGSLGKLQLNQDQIEFKLVAKYDYIHDLSKNKDGLQISARIEKRKANQFDLIAPSSCILPLKNERLISCQTGGGYKFSIKGQVVLDIIDFPRINHLVQLSDSDFVAGTDVGLYRLHINSQVGEAHHSKIFDGQISALAFKNDIVYAGKAHDGLVYFPKDSTHLQKRIEGYRSYYINCIEVESNCRIWIGTANGVDVLEFNKDKKLTLTEHWSTKNGLPSSVVNDIEFHKQKAYVMTDKGMAIIPSSHLAPKHPPLLFFVEIKVNWKLRKPQDEILKLSYDENNIQLAFDKIDLNHTQPFHYQYRMKKNGTWSSTQNKVIEFSKLEPGDYNFQLKSNRHSQILELPIYISRPWWNNWYAIIAYITVAILIISWIIRVRFAQIRHQSMVAQQMNTLKFRALRAQMNPHFIYNALNAAQSFVLTESKEKATDFLNHLSRLIRLIFENSSKDFVIIESEINSINLYVEVEKKRYPNAFDFKIEMEQFQQSIKIPPMMIQPFIENAILHGVLPKSTHGNISLTLSLKEKHIKVVIEDDGIGIEAAKEIGKKKRNVLGSSAPKERESAIQVTTKRIETLAKQHNLEASISIIDQSKLNQSKTGTYVSFNLPFETT